MNLPVRVYMIFLVHFKIVFFSLLAAFSLFISTSCSAEGLNVKAAVVKIFTVANSPSYHHPWRLMGQRNVHGSGCIIAGNRILTNAHVVSDAMFIQVRRAGRAEKVPARVVAVDHDCDLALLTVDNMEFFSGVKPVALGFLPHIRDKVAVYGFPEGGDKISITEGVISRIEHVNYAHAGAYLLSCQMDASINAGNSGGPVIMDNRIVGVAFQAMSGGDYENIGYMVPATIIHHFLHDIADGRVDGIPGIGVAMEKLENSDLRSFYRMKKYDTGALVIKVYPKSPARGKLMAGDVILKVDGRDIANDGTIEFRKDQRTYFGYIIQQKYIGDSVEFSVLRNGKEKKVRVSLTRPLGIDRLVPYHQYDIRPRYFIYGGLVFEPLVLNYLQEFAPGSDWYMYVPSDLLDFFMNGEPHKGESEVVILISVLPDTVNMGYHEIANNVITTVNDRHISCFNDLIHAIENGRDRYVRIEDDRGYQIILDRNKVARRMPEILKKYQIVSDRFAP